MSNRLSQLAFLLLLAATLTAQAATTVFDFEEDGGIAAWRIRSAGQDKLERTPRFATSGTSSMMFTTPAWKEGMEQWPAFDAKPPVKDWRPYDRLMVDITNPQSERQFFALLISDSKVPFRKGLNYRFDLPAHGFKRFIIPLSKFPETVDRSDIAIVHFFGQRPTTDMQLYVDQIALLKKGESPPTPLSSFAGQVARLVLDGLGAAEQTLPACARALGEICDSPRLQQRADAEMAKLKAQLDAIKAEIESPNITLARVAELREFLDHLPRRGERLAALLRFEKEYIRLGLPDNGMLVGFATSMEKILPRHMPFTLTAARDVHVRLARNEKESLQVAVIPTRQPLRKVSVAVSDLKSPDGKVLPATNIDCDVMGYVETKKRPPYAVSYVGWWPDPILGFLGPIDIAVGDVQTFWVRVRAPRNQAPGVYRGSLRVSAEGVDTVTFTLTVTVHTFTLPDHTPLPTAITFFERKKQMGGEENWSTMKFTYADFLADYYIDYDSLYRRGEPDFEIVQRLHTEKRLVAFNLGNVFNAGIKDKNVDAAVQATVDRLRPAYNRAKELGLLEYAYIYGFDERRGDQFPLLEKCAAALRKAFPEVLLMTTSYDHSFGLDSCVKTIDAWCPLTPKFDMEQVAKSRATGRKVWWYICCGPRNPYANWFVEYAAIESRLLMGAMAAKYRPDGFLYYSLSIWNKNKPIESGPFTDWNPVSWTTFHGDGSLLCSGPGGKPVPTIRLENYRDGLEDFAYVCILQEIIRRHKAKGDELTAAQKQWLADAVAAIQVPETLVQSLKEYSHNPDDLYAYRRRIADLIDRSGMPDVNPWGSHFNVRGFPVQDR